jgi:predicted Zn-dependent protease
MVAARRTRLARLAAPAALACALAAPLALGQSLPDLGDVSAASLSETQERTIGNRIMREVVLDPAYIDDPDIGDYINALGGRLVSAAEGPRRDIDFFVVQDDQINAFAMVGGHIGVNTALILLTQNESELAGVVAHEIAHVLQKHQARMVHGASRSQWTSLAALALALIASRSGGSQSGQVTEAAIASAGALQLQNQIDYTREHEREADRVGLTLLDRAGYDPRGMATFFERLLRANRLNEFKGMPSYLRTHPLTTERIADIQDRLPSATFRMTPDTFEYRLVRAKIRAAAGTPSEAVTWFRNVLADQTVYRPREEAYGLALAQRRARDLDGAWKTLAPLRSEGTAHPAFEVLAGQLLADQGRGDEAIAVYRKALEKWPQHRSLLHAYLRQLLESGRAADVIADLEQRLRTTQGDPVLYELEARAYAAKGRGLSQHRAQAEAYYRRGNLAAAVDQLELANKAKGADFYEQSSVESRLRELRVLLENERAAEKALKIS